MRSVPPLACRMTSESFVISTANRIVYRGRIDDRFAAVGRLRTRITSHDLRDIVEDVSRGGRAEPYETEAVGCFHYAWGELGEPGAGTGEVTWARHVAPLLQANCVECRRGGIAPFSLEGYDNAKRWHRMVAWMTDERLMPPWRPVPGSGEFRDARRLSARQIELLWTWSRTGARFGDPEDTMPISTRPVSKWRLGEPDLVLAMREPFEVPANGDDIYRYFVIPAEFAEDKVVVALDFSPGDPRVVHHANYLIDYEGRARAEDAKDEAPGFSVFGDRRLSRLQRLGNRRVDAGGRSPGSSIGGRGCGCPGAAIWSSRCTIT